MDGHDHSQRLAMEYRVCVFATSIEETQLGGADQSLGHQDHRRGRESRRHRDDR